MSVNKLLILFGVDAVTYEVYSFDFDGCTANYLFLSSKHKDILAANKALFDQIKSSHHRKVIYIGSNRQAPRDDLANSTADERGSCYPAIQMIADELDGVLDNFLLGDIYNDLPDGTCFKQALKHIAKNHKDYKEFNEKKFKSLYNWTHDESKLTVIYAQIHKVSLEHPNDPIHFNFFDDREDILKQLHAYFSKYPDLIPSNVILNLKQYRGPIDNNGHEISPLVVDYPSVNGIRSEADRDYRETVKTMAAVTIEKMSEQGMDIIATGASKAITSYAEAQKYGFDMSAIKCINHYEPGMIPNNPPNSPVIKKEKLVDRLHFYKRSNAPKDEQPHFESPHTATYSSHPILLGSMTTLATTVPTSEAQLKFFSAQPSKCERKIEGLMGTHKSNSPEEETTNINISPADTDHKNSEQIPLMKFS